MASLFQQCVREEIDSVFLNLDEFAGPVSLDGRPVKAIVSHEALEFPDASDDRLAVCYDAMTLRLRLEDITPGKYQPELRVNFNGETWRVLSCDRRDVVTLKLYRERV